MRNIGFIVGRRTALAALLAVWLASATRAEAGVYAYAQQEINNFSFTGGTLGTISALSSTSAVQNGVPAGSEGMVATTDPGQSFIGPAGTEPAENFFGQAGAVNPDYVRGDVLISPPSYDSNSVAEGYLNSAGISSGLAAWSLSALVTVTSAGTVELAFDYDNHLSVIFQNGFPAMGQASASYALNFTIATPGVGGSVLFESSPIAVNSSASRISPGSIISTDSGRVTITSTQLAAGTYQATLTGSSRVFLSASPVPEPSTIAGLAFGAIAALGYARKRKSRA